jgi:predicted negative regulator of RcsB-dependent stress response
MAGSYDFEEQERLAELKAWWEDNRWYVVGAVAAVLIVFFGYRGWNYWNAQQSEDASLMYRAMADAPKAQQAAQVDALVAKHPRSFYASDAELLLAKASFDAGNLADAQKRLEWVVEHGVEEHRGIARMRLAAVLLEQKKFAEGLKVLDGNSDPAFAPLANDLRGDIMLAQGRIDEARAAYKAAAEKADARSPVKGIAEVKLNALGGAQ